MAFSSRKPSGQGRSPRQLRPLLATLLGLVWLVAGTAVLLGLEQVWRRSEPILFLNRALRNFTDGLTVLVTAVLQLSAAALFAALALLGLVLLVGGVIRLLRLLIMLRPRRRRHRFSESLVDDGSRRRR
ncbi:MAG: hypothetical protein ERJ67_07545 [Aphanocapsa feldmannii 277cV]|uniref:Uncharacterized protein n=2 Tax=Aphanocapsa feldmannii TaxID=192050 RepID=A0A524RMJ2_9CHRO|nr:MAG: hypothetical protein ERJ69_06605 [Aphanocapsa feldmannii 288cV]TGG91846.1 MAG: hypothetical protein ERJ67_07545 [Aphanocapsa feldmannii 277cV]TGH21117.1 MAG: hypothetical protein ERJ68_05915 [Aphanocapsa feldmannii 277cI]